MKHQRLFVQNGLITVRLVPELATEIGLHESLILLQVDYLLSVRGRDSVNPVKPETLYISDSVRQMQTMFFPFFSVSTIGQTIIEMVERGLLEQWSSEDTKDQTRWLTLGLECSNLQSVVLVDSDVRAKPAKPNKKEAKPPSVSIFSLAQALAQVCEIDFDMDKGRMLREAKNFKDRTPEEIITLFGKGGAWYKMDWRGQRGSPPTVAQVKTEWMKISKSSPASVTSPKGVAVATVKASDGGLNI